MMVDVCRNTDVVFKELRDMQYLQATISETLRLYPLVPVDTRNCKNDEWLQDGTFIGKN